MTGVTRTSGNITMKRITQRRARRPRAAVLPPGRDLSPGPCPGLPPVRRSWTRSKSSQGRPRLPKWPLARPPGRRRRLETTGGRTGTTRTGATLPSGNIITRRRWTRQELSPADQSPGQPPGLPPDRDQTQSFRSYQEPRPDRKQSFSLHQEQPPDKSQSYSLHQEQPPDKSQLYSRHLEQPPGRNL